MYLMHTVPNFPIEISVDNVDQIDWSTLPTVQICCNCFWKLCDTYSVALERRGAVKKASVRQSFRKRVIRVKNDQPNSPFVKPRQLIEDVSINRPDAHRQDSTKPTPPPVKDIKCPKCGEMKKSLPALGENGLAICASCSIQNTKRSCGS